MQKENLIGKRVAVWKKNSPNNGKTGLILKDYQGAFQIILEGEPNMIGTFLQKELYFPDSPLGYNQKCFNQ